MEIRLEWHSGFVPRLSQRALGWIIDPSACDWLKMRKAALMVWISLLVQGQFCMMDQFDVSSFCGVPTLCFALAPSVSHGAQGHYARKLLNDLMEDYSNALRPVEDTDSALNVSLQITLSQIKDMVSRAETQTHIITEHRFKDTTVHPSHRYDFNHRLSSL